MLAANEWIMVLSAAGIGVVHTLAGPDHYLPFIALAKARDWTIRKTLFVTTLCGIGHVGSSFAIGVAALGLGYGVHKITPIDNIRGDIAAWGLVVFGIAYALWGVYRRWKRQRSQSLHFHEMEEDATHSHALLFNNQGHSHTHPQDHFHVHGRTHKLSQKWGVTPWVLFIIFVFGPCEVFIPTYLYPSYHGSTIAVFAVTASFLISTVGTMNLLVYISSKGMERLKWGVLERQPHIFAGGILFLSGLAVILGL